MRTEKGRQIVHDAIREGYATLEKVDTILIQKSQINLLFRRQALWGRLFTLKLFGIPIPKFKGFHLLKNWFGLEFIEKIKSFVGTARRIITRGQFKPQERKKPE